MEGEQFRHTQEREVNEKYREIRNKQAQERGHTMYKKIN